MNQEPPTAFPWTHDNMTCTGMTLRDYFAAKAMQGYCSNQQHTSNCTVEITADGAYEVADAMMKARETK
jgi:hypothetical protein